MPHRPAHLCRLLLLFSLIFAWRGSASAATKVTAADGLWSSTATWGGTLPAAADDIVITHAVTATTNLTMNNLDITTTGTLSVNPVTVQVKGNFTLHPGGTFNAGTSTMRFSGATGQTISGSPTFYVLRADNVGLSTDATAVVAVDPIVCLSSLVVNDGQFMMANGQVNDILVSGTGGVLFKPLPGAIITVTGATGAGVAFSRIGTFTHNNSKFIFAGSGRQVVAAGAFYDVEVANTAAVPSTTNEVDFSGSVSNQLIVSDGQVGIANGISVKNVTIAAGATLRQAGELRISGNLVNNGTLAHGGYKTKLNGAGSQTLSGTLSFGTLESDNSGAVSDATAVAAVDAVHTTGTLTVTRGIFLLSTGSQVNDISISGNTGAAMKATAGATITVTGANSSNISFQRLGGGASFTHNNSKFIFAGSGRQVVTAGGFYDVEVANTASTPNSTNEVEFSGSVSHDLLVSDGQISLTGSLPTVTVGPAGRVRYRALVSITGNFTNNGVLDDAGFATRFGGVGSQTMSGTGLTFSLLTIDNTGAVDDATAVTATGPITTTGTVSVTRGQFMPSNGSHFNDIAISGNSGAKMKPVASATITVTGANGSNVAMSLAGGSGSFVHNNSTFVLAGSGRQTVAGSHWNLEVANTAATPDSTNEVAFSGTLANDLTITDGQFSHSNNITPRNVTIAPAGTLRQGSLLRVAGDLAANGGFLNGGFATHFVGSGPQLVSGSPTFGAVQVQNNAATPSDTDAVIFQDPFICTGLLDVNRGRVLLSNDVTVQRFFLNLGASCKAGTGRRLTITGADGSGNAFSPYGDFFHNNGTVVFAGSGMQKVENAADFWNLEVANTAAVPGTSAEVYENGNIENNLTILDGQISLGFGSNFGTTTVGPNGSLRLRDERWFGSTLVVDGVTDFSGAPIVAFFSAGMQHFTASVPVAFSTVRIVNGTTLVEDGTANATATGLDLQGTNRLQRFIASVPTGPVGGGLTGVALNVTTLGTLGALTIERFETVANAAPQHATADASFTFDVAGATGYTVDLTLPHALSTPANAQVSSYLGTGTNWDFAQNSYTANSVTRTGLSSLASVWAVGDSALTNIDEWQLLQD